MGKVRLETVLPLYFRLVDSTKKIPDVFVGVAKGLEILDDCAPFDAGQILVHLFHSRLAVLAYTLPPGSFAFGVKVCSSLPRTTLTVCTTVSPIPDVRE